MAVATVDSENGESASGSSLEVDALHDHGGAGGATRAPGGGAGMWGEEAGLGVDLDPVKL